MTRAIGFLIVFLAAFLAGWLMGADFPPPHVKDIRIGGAFWLFLAGGGMVAGMAMSAGRDRR